MKQFLYCLAVCALIFAVGQTAFSQVATKSGEVYGKVLDDKGAPLPGVSVTLESSVIPTQTASTGPTGAFRFANLPPGLYAVTFTLQGFTEIRQEDVRVSTGSHVQLQIPMKVSPNEILVINGGPPVVDREKTGNESTYSREYLDKVPSGRDPWVLLDQTPGNKPASSHAAAAATPTFITMTV